MNAVEHHRQILLEGPEIRWSDDSTLLWVMRTDDVICPIIVCMWGFLSTHSTPGGGSWKKCGYHTRAPMLPIDSMTFRTAIPRRCFSKMMNVDTPTYPQRTHLINTFSNVMGTLPLVAMARFRV